VLDIILFLERVDLMTQMGLKKSPGENYPPRRKHYPPRRKHYPPRRKHYPPRRKHYPTISDNLKRVKFVLPEKL